MPMLRPAQGGFHNYWCPACRCAHTIDSRWTIEGTPERPTLKGSVLTEHFRMPEPDPATGDYAKGPDGKYLVGADGKLLGGKRIVCHSLVVDGMIQYLADCTHEMAGR